ncbi:MAG: hypothetical protein CMJ18_21975 [Phycisphaeraceae bacterium]|nr:hypothetical protein [Phycisphaeraceae bacterium]
MGGARTDNLKVLTATLRRITGSDNPHVDRALSAALPTAGAAEAGRIGEVLLARGHTEGTLGLVLEFERLPARLQASVCERVSDLFPALRQAAAMRDGPGPRHAVEIIRRGRATSLSYLLSDQLIHGPADLKREAARCLYELAMWCRTDRIPGTRPVCDGRASRYLQEVVERAVAVYDGHRQADVLLALAALTPRPVRASFELAALPRSPMADPWRRMLQSADDPNVCRALVPSLAHEPLAADACAGLRRAVAGSMLSEVLASSHLLRDAALAEALSARGRMTFRTLGDTYDRGGAAHRARGLVWFAAAVDDDPVQQVRLLDRLRADGDRFARLVALRRLIEVDLAPRSRRLGARKCIGRFCFDPESRIAMLAARHLMRVQAAELPSLMVQLTNSAHVEVRQTASRWLGPRGFEQLWDGWPRLDPERRRSVGRALMKVDAAFHVTLGRRLEGADRAGRLRALAIVAGLNQGDLFEPALLALACSRDPVIQASAASALATVRSDEARQVLLGLLDHEDGRVRANAIEALEPLDLKGDAKHLIGMIDADQNRPRANAIKAAMKLNYRDALSALSKMLGDDRKRHRISALWVVESTGLVDVASEVAEMSITDPDVQVQGRAERVVGRLIEQMEA